MTETTEGHEILSADSGCRHSINPDAIPQRLKDIPRWICWEQNGKVKQPIHANGFNISVTDPKNWGCFDAVLQVAQNRQCGIGFCFNGDGLIGIDIDDCRDPVTGEIQKWATYIIQTLDSYAEISPSGTGVKIWVSGTLPEKFKSKHIRPDKAGAVEIYAAGRYFTVTTNHLPGTPSEVNERTEELATVYVFVSGWKPAAKSGKLLPAPVTPTPRGVDPVDDDRARIPAALAVICPDDYEVWTNVGMSLNDFDPSSEGLALFIGWSRGSEKFEEGECEKKWASFEGGGGLTIATLFKLADESNPSWRQVSRNRYDTTYVKTLGCVEVSSETTQPVAALTLLWQPFPAGSVPSPFGEYVEAKAAAIDVDPSQIYLPLLTAAGAAIGNAYRLHVQDDWCVPAILWTATVCESGSAKTPSLNAALRFTNRRQARSWEKHQEELKEFKNLEAYHKKSMVAWERNKTTSDDPPAAPERPILQQFSVSDCTVEALVTDLQENPRGLLVARDEISAWFGSHDRYAAKGSADQAAYLEMYNAGPVSSNRKGSGRLYVPSAAVSITGTIQPGILRRVLGNEQRESGLQARFLWAFPERRIRGFPGVSVSQEIEDRVSAVFDRLWSLDFDIDAEGRKTPHRLGMTPRALEMFRDNTLSMRTEAFSLGADLHAALSKLEEIPARLGLIIHSVRVAADDFSIDDPNTVDESSIQAGIDLTTWFKNETKRVYSMLRSKPQDPTESTADQSQRHLLDWITKKGGAVTERDVTRNLGTKYPRVSDAESALQQLVDHSQGYWESVEPTALGGRPTRKFVVSA